MAYLSKSDCTVDRLIGRLRSAGQAVDLALRAPGHYPEFRREDLESLADDIVVAECLLRKLVE